MADLFFPEVQPNERATALGLEVLPASFGQGFGAAFEETVTRNPVPSFLRELDRSKYREGKYYDEFGIEQVQPAERARMLEPDEANEKYGIKGRLNFTTPTPEPIAENLRSLKVREIELQDIRRRAGSGIGTALTAGILGSLLDPLNIALAFVPVVGPARMAMMAERIGVPAARVATGAIEGGVGAALIEPLVLGVASQEQADYTAVDSLMNVVFGSVLGGGLHLGAGFVGDRLRGRAEAPPLPKLIDNLPQQDQAALLRTAVAQVAEGRPVDIAAVLDAANPVLPRAVAIAEARIRLAEISEKAGFQRGAEDILALREATRVIDEAGKLTPEMKKAVEILKKPGFLRTSEDKIFLAGLERADDAAPEVRGADALAEKIRKGEAPKDFAEAANMAIARVGKDAVLRKVDDALARPEAATPEGRKAAVERAVWDTAEGVYDQELSIDVRADDVTARAYDALRTGREASIRASVDRATQSHVDPIDERGMAAADQVLAEDINVKTVDDEVAKLLDEVNELESYLPEGVEPSQAVKDLTKEANLFDRAWRAAAACGLRKA